MKTTLKSARVQLTALGYRIKRVDSDYRVTEATCRNRDHGFEDSDLESLIGTAKITREHGISCCED